MWAVKPLSSRETKLLCEKHQNELTEDVNKVVEVGNVH